jgi:hypothetical protein
MIRGVYQAVFVPYTATAADDIQVVAHIYGNRIPTPHAENEANELIAWIRNNAVHDAAASQRFAQNPIMARYPAGAAPDVQIYTIGEYGYMIVQERPGAGPAYGNYVYGFMNRAPAPDLNMAALPGAAFPAPAIDLEAGGEVDGLAVQPDVGLVDPLDGAARISNAVGAMAAQAGNAILDDEAAAARHQAARARLAAIRANGQLNALAAPVDVVEAPADPAIEGAIYNLPAVFAAARINYVEDIPRSASLFTPIVAQDFYLDLNARQKMTMLLRPFTQLPIESVSSISTHGIVGDGDAFDEVIDFVDWLEVSPFPREAAAFNFDQENPIMQQFGAAGYNPAMELYRTPFGTFLVVDEDAPIRGTSVYAWPNNEPAPALQAPLAAAPALAIAPVGDAGPVVAAPAAARANNPGRAIRAPADQVNQPPAPAGINQPPRGLSPAIPTVAAQGSWLAGVNVQNLPEKVSIFSIVSNEQRPADGRRKVVVWIRVANDAAQGGYSYFKAEGDAVPLLGQFSAVDSAEAVTEIRSDLSGNSRFENTLHFMNNSPTAQGIIRSALRAIFGEVVVAHISDSGIKEMMKGGANLGFSVRNEIKRERQERAVEIANLPDGDPDQEELRNMIRSADNPLRVVEAAAAFKNSGWKFVSILSPPKEGTGAATYFCAAWREDENGEPTGNGITSQARSKPLLPQHIASARYIHPADEIIKSLEKRRAAGWRNQPVDASRYLASNRIIDGVRGLGGGVIEPSTMQDRATFMRLVTHKLDSALGIEVVNVAPGGADRLAAAVAAAGPRATPFRAEARAYNSESGTILVASINARQVLILSPDEDAAPEIKARVILHDILYGLKVDPETPSIMSEGEARRLVAAVEVQTERRGLCYREGKIWSEGADLPDTHEFSLPATKVAAESKSLAAAGQAEGEAKKSNFKSSAAAGEIAPGGFTDDPTKTPIDRLKRLGFKVAGGCMEALTSDGTKLAVHGQKGVPFGKSQKWILEIGAAKIESDSLQAVIDRALARLNGDDAAGPGEREDHDLPPDDVPFQHGV